MKIKQIKAREILDSRGNPTVETEITCENGVTEVSAVPSGASTGKYEALELRDENPDRYLGKGVLKAVENVNAVIAPKLIGLNVKDQEKIDQTMIELDGTADKSRLGANAILSISMAVAKCASRGQKEPLYLYLNRFFDKEIKLPIPMFNILNGGKHAIGSTDLQEFMIMPIGAEKISTAIRWGAEVFHHLGKIIKQKGLSVLVGDEGGYAPALSSNKEPLELILKAIENAGYVPGKQIAIALDPAASEIYSDGKYILAKEQKELSSMEMAEMYKEWIGQYPIVSIEDGFSEDDWDGFQKLTREVGKKIQIVGDDLFVTNRMRLKRGIELEAGNSILVKLNQIGTVTETVKTIKMAYDNNMTVVVSHRSGETEDTFLADFAVACGCGQIKTGSLCRSERIAKYNRLMKIGQEIEEGKLADFPFKL